MYLLDFLEKFGDGVYPLACDLKLRFRYGMTDYLVIPHSHKEGGESMKWRYFDASHRSRVKRVGIFSSETVSISAGIWGFIFSGMRVADVQVLSPGRKLIDSQRTLYLICL